MISNTRRGFTVIELIVVLAIVSLVVATSVPLFTGFQAGRRLKASSFDLTAALRTAQSHTLTTRRRHSVVLDIVTGEFWMEDELGDLVDVRKHLARGTDVEEVTGVTPEGSRARFEFVTPHGGIKRTGSGPIVITLKSSKGKTNNLVINPLTGSVKIQ